MQTDYRKLLQGYIAHVRRCAGDDFIDNLSIADRQILFSLSPRTSHLGATIEQVGGHAGWFSNLLRR